MIKNWRLFTLNFPYGHSPPPPSRFPARASYLTGRDNSLATASQGFFLLHIVGGAAAHIFLKLKLQEEVRIGQSESAHSIRY